MFEQDSKLIPFQSGANLDRTQVMPLSRAQRLLEHSNEPLSKTPTKLKEKVPNDFLPKVPMRKIVIEEPMLQKDPSRYLRNNDILGSSPKEASGPIPKKFKDLHTASPDPKV
jgi:hypothetical protein